MSSVARHGKDGQELKLKTIGPTFFYFRGMPTIACVQTLPSLQKKIGKRGPLSPLISVGGGGGGGGARLYTGYAYNNQLNNYHG